MGWGEAPNAQKPKPHIPSSSSSPILMPAAYWRARGYHLRQKGVPCQLSRDCVKIFNQHWARRGEARSGQGWRVNTPAFGQRGDMVNARSYVRTDVHAGVRARGRAASCRQEGDNYRLVHMRVRKLSHPKPHHPTTTHPPPFYPTLLLFREWDGEGRGWLGWWGGMCMREIFTCPTKDVYGPSNYMHWAC